MINRNHPKFLFLKQEIEKYIAQGELLGTTWLNNKHDVKNKANKIRRCPLGVVAYNNDINLGSENDRYEMLENKYSLSFRIGVGFDNVIYSQNCGLTNEDSLIGQEIARYCLENKWIKKKIG